MLPEHHRSMHRVRAGLIKETIRETAGIEVAPSTKHGSAMDENTQFMPAGKTWLAVMSMHKYKNLQCSSTRFSPVTMDRLLDSVHAV